MRSETSIVLAETSACPRLKGVKHARIAIDRLNPTAQSGLLGYQLIAVDEQGTMLCSGTELLGIRFQIDPRRKPVVIEQIARAKVTHDTRQGGSEPQEYRLAYLISQAGQQDKSLCTNPLGSIGTPRRVWRGVVRSLLRRGNPQIEKSDGAWSQPDSNQKLDKIPEVLPVRLNEYAVIIPNGEYDEEGQEYIPSSRNLPPLGSASQSEPGEVSLEWFEFACAGGALAHTDLGGLVKVGDPQQIRTAALWMFLAWYNGKQNNTLPGVPISYMRITEQDSTTATDRCPMTEGDKSGADATGNVIIEAKWDHRGATCMSPHSRLWMKDMIITKARMVGGKDLFDGERKFRDQFKKIPQCGTPEEGSLGGKPLFVSCARNHIDH